MNEVEKFPNGWRVVRVGEVCELKYGKSLPESARNPGQFLVYGSNGSIGSHSSALTAEPVIIIGRKGSIGEINWSDKKCFPIDTTYFVDETRNDLCLEWLALILRASSLQTLNKASGVPGLNREDVYRLEIPLPPLPEQKRIAQILKTKLAAVEQARQASEARLAAARELPAAYLREVFESETVRNSPTVSLRDCCLVNPRRPTLNYDANDLVTFVPMAAVDDVTGKIIAPEEKHFAEVSRGYTYFEEGDVLFSKITPCMQNGKHAIALNLRCGFGFGTTEFHVLRPCDNLDSHWLHAFLRQPEILRRAEKNFTGSVGQQRVPPSFLETLEIPLPPLPEQKRITQILKTKLAAVEQARQAAEMQQAAIQALPASLLRQAFSGVL